MPFVADMNFSQTTTGPSFAGLCPGPRLPMGWWVPCCGSSNSVVPTTTSSPAMSPLDPQIRTVVCFVIAVLEAWWRASLRRLA
jgi:hypothetical protein